MERGGGVGVNGIVTQTDGQADTCSRGTACACLSTCRGVSCRVVSWVWSGRGRAGGADHMPESSGAGICVGVGVGVGV